jgi:uncharacterized RDD family membrane protein YckC
LTTVTTPLPDPSYWGPPRWAPDTNLLTERVIQYIVDILITNLSLVPLLVLAMVGLVLDAAVPFYVVLGVLWVVLSYVWSAWVWVFYPHRHHAQTWGMRLEEIEVVDAATLGPPTLGQLAIRWLLLLLIDGSIVGLLLIALTDHNQRVGDMAAKTYVVRVDAAPPTGQAAAAPPVYR